jgi:hypothetical protein
MVEADADLEDAVIQATVRRPRVAPEELEGLVLLEELPPIELFDPFEELRWWRSVAPSPDRLKDLASRNALGWACGLAVAASRRRASIR